MEYIMAELKINGNPMLDISGFITAEDYSAARLSDFEKLTEIGQAVIGYHYEINARLSDIPEEFAESLSAALSGDNIMLTFSFGTGTLTEQFTVKKYILKSPAQKSDGEYWGAEIAFVSDTILSDDCL
jgi:hypothetical protein